MVETRSQYKQKAEQIQQTYVTEYNNPGIYEVNIDFDEASEAWNSNKIRTSNGEYKYVCGEHNTHTGKYCKRKLYGTSNKCRSHL